MQPGVQPSMHPGMQPLPMQPGMPGMQPQSGMQPGVPGMQPMPQAGAAVALCFGLRLSNHHMSPDEVCTPVRAMC